ncbi:hypothetical protein PS862_04133 [Pseudomonas fluorescens]|uniref:Uncharacterized protein n=1 Tax=Pseudomonas fluorescens TaxID=294 RepID=A0A5E7MNW5_PSEFL|nr:hypothetical protein [Pseudomonas fluorescens]VVP26484.1 hypothetical protein PS862_04133 [Pseudomonas fluorescens]
MKEEWVIGLMLSLVGGGIVCWIFLKALRWWLGDSPKPRLSEGSKGVPPWITGVIERLFFTILIGLEVSAGPTAMIGWLGLKLATNWNHPDWKGKPNARTHALSALLGGLISMLFAMLGGLICAGTLEI